jgi:hypothetical protein
MDFVQRSRILNTREHSFSETGSVSVSRRGEGDTYSVGSLRKNKHQSLETDPFSETLRFLVISNSEDKPSDSDLKVKFCPQAYLSITTRRQEGVDDVQLHTFISALGESERSASRSGPLTAPGAQ